MGPFPSMAAVAETWSISRATQQQRHKQQIKHNWQQKYQRMSFNPGYLV